MLTEVGAAQEVARLGYVPRKTGTVERLLSVAESNQVGTVRVEIYEFDMPLVRHDPPV
jgi:hypothetical protein